ncbi:FtsK/SpoIIIE domain-containing protein [Arthrobacter sp. USHLN218]|uniref:FtsK/SpoIIIE domain-containing protein n=1 Tax=Arthrobacter sp. USHLN218 TaxID=3081232 RepID=UPI003019DDD6
MPLHLSVAASENLPPSYARRTAELREIVADDGAADASALAQWLLDRLGAEAGELSLTVAGSRLQDLVPHRPPLVNGAVVVCGLPARHPEGLTMTAEAEAGVPALTLAVTGGPDAGKLLELARGEHILGRDGATLVVEDPQLSRRHARITVDNRTIKVTDLGSANGLWARGRRVPAADLTSASGITAGSSRMALFLAVEPVQALTPDEDLGTPVQVAAAAPDPRGKLTLLLGGLPLVAGVALAVITGMWFFLAFSAVSLLTAAIPYAAGSRKRRAFAAAVAAAAAADARRRTRSAPDPATLVYGRLRDGPADPAAAAPEHVWLRLGTTDQEANIASGGGADALRKPHLPDAPLAVDLLADRRISCTGPESAVRRLLNSCLLQLGARAVQSDLVIICYGEATSLPGGARFLPGVVLASRPEVLAAELRNTRGPTVLLVSGRHDEAEAALKECAADPTVVRFYAPRTDDEVQIRLGSGPGRLHRDAATTPFRPDLVSDTTLERFARLVARSPGAAPRKTGGAVPATCGLRELLSGAPSGRWIMNATVPGIPAVIGTGAAGPLTLDLAAEGPHLLIAGTTGAGKSELLRSLVLGLACEHAPDKINFLLIDFKGGSGLGVLADLPHSSGLLTDLTPSNVARALSWLRAEARRRELEFARLGVADIRDCPPGQLPRLIVVVDEFRMLADEVPLAIPELMRIAALGRSLGLHLVMATQRPQGAISADIRANVTSSIALRVQTALESSDLAGTSKAAAIAVDTPGRAYLRIGPAEAREFQSASALIVPEAAAAAAATLRDWLGLPASERRSAPPAAADGASPDPVGELVAEIRQAAAAAGSAVPLKIPPPLPDLLTLESLPAASRANSLPLGLLDLPTEQRQLLLDWLPEEDGHLAALGTSGSGTRFVVQAVAAGVLASAAERHLYVLDGDGSLAFAAGAARTGAYAGPLETDRAARILRRLAQEAAGRIAADGAAAPLANGGAVPLIVLLSGWGRWASAFRDGRLGWAEESLLHLARDGAAAAITLCLSGDRELAVGRMLGMAPNRLFFPAFAGPEALMAWPKLPVMEPFPGRALVHGPLVPAAEAVAQLAEVPVTSRPAAARERSGSTGRRPFRIEPLPQEVRAEDLPVALGDGLVIGVEGDELGPSVLRVDPGGPLMVLGPAGSGKTNLLALLARQAQHLYRCFRVPPDADPSAYWSSLDVPGPGALLLVDDAHRLAPPAHQQLACLVDAGASAVLAARPGPGLLQQVPLAVAARASGRGYVLSPASPADGDFFGLRLDSRAAPPGRAYRLEHGGAVPLQTGLVRG